jgi:hypothetical protein
LDRGLTAGQARLVVLVVAAAVAVLALLVATFLETQVEQEEPENSPRLLSCFMAVEVEVVRMQTLVQRLVVLVEEATEATNQ